MDLRSGSQIRVSMGSDFEKILKLSKMVLNTSQIDDRPKTGSNRAQNTATNFAIVRMFLVFECIFLFLGVLIIPKLQI